MMQLVSYKLQDFFSKHNREKKLNHCERTVYLNNSIHLCLKPDDLNGELHTERNSLFLKNTKLVLLTKAVVVLVINLKNAPGMFTDVTAKS